MAELEPIGVSKQHVCRKGAPAPLPFPIRVADSERTCGAGEGHHGQNHFVFGKSQGGKLGLTVVRWHLE